MNLDTISLPAYLGRQGQQKSKYLKAKEELWKFKYFTNAKNTIFQKNSPKETKVLQDVMNSIITNLKFQHKPKYHHFLKSSYKNRPTT
jgi:hypothetical protein